MIKNRNVVMVVVLSFLTLGIYSIYWFYVTAKEMVTYKGLDGSPGLWTVMLFIPIANFFAFWKHCQAVEAMTDGKYNALLMFLAWFVFFPIVLILTQTELNKLARSSA